MNRDQLQTLLMEVASHTCPVERAMNVLRDMPFEDASVALIDHHRSLRTGIPEVIYGAGKTPEQIAVIVDRMVKNTGSAIVTRASRAAVELVQEKFPEARDYAAARLIAVGSFPEPVSERFVAV